MSKINWLEQIYCQQNYRPIENIQRLAHAHSAMFHF